MRPAFGQHCGGLGRAECASLGRTSRGAPESLSNPASGYSLIEAKSLDGALAKAKKCPIPAAGGSVEVAETIDM